MNTMRTNITIFGILFLLVIGFVSQGWSATGGNPQLRACRLTGGLIRVADLAAPVNDQYMFCQYGEAMLDAISVMEFLNGKNVLALKAYKKSLQPDSEACGHLGGSVVLGSDLEGLAVSYCSFQDRSLIDLLTLSKGKNSEDNYSFNKAFSL